MVFLVCEDSREVFFRDVLERDFELSRLESPALLRPAKGDVVLLDLAPERGDWRTRLEEARRCAGEEARLVAVLSFEQIRALERRAPLDDFISEGSTGVEMRARLRRQAAEERGAEVARAGLEIDADRYEVRVDGVPVELTFKEFELLRFLASRPGKVFTREMLLEQVWGYDYFGGSRTVDVHVRRIRAKIEREGHTYIRTVRGVGYIFEHHPPSP
ncbi:MAG: response regulator transcription factor [Actinobacteria bacterium]|nr:response regulator transcription factor [Actinomycetota bacterium]MDI6830588.1 response regulator transcription factor [Actinomycetota bacterium]